MAGSCDASVEARPAVRDAEACAAPAVASVACQAESARLGGSSEAAVDARPSVREAGSTAAPAVRHAAASTTAAVASVGSQAEAEQPAAEPSPAAIEPPAEATAASAELAAAAEAARELEAYQTDDWERYLRLGKQRRSVLRQAHSISTCFSKYQVSHFGSELNASYVTPPSEHGALTYCLCRSALAEDIYEYSRIIAAVAFAVSKLNDMTGDGPPLEAPGGLPVPSPLDAVAAENDYLQALLTDGRAAIAAGVFLEDAMDTMSRDAAAKWLLNARHPRNVSRAYRELEWE